MANPVHPGTFDNWITDRISFTTGSPKSGETGSFDRWLTDLITFNDYTEAETVTPPSTAIPVLMASYRRRRT